VISELLVLNFNFHIEHHLFPNLPWYRLRAARRLIKPTLGVGYRRARGLGWLMRERKRNLVDVLSQASSDFDSVRPTTVDQGREVPT
jgi:fatty acid desaturase